jgi:hypothetical protein
MQAATAYPEIYRNEKAARYCLGRDRTWSKFPYLSMRRNGLRSCRYQLLGRGRHIAAALVDPAAVPDPRAWLEARLGPLVDFWAGSGPSVTASVDPSPEFHRQNPRPASRPGLSGSYFPWRFAGSAARRPARPTGHPIATANDEIATANDEAAFLVPNDMQVAVAIADIASKEMVAAFLDVFPNAPTVNLVEPKLGSNWGDLHIMAGSAIDAPGASLLHFHNS